MARKPTEERREEIVQALLALAAERGASNVSTQAIADRVGIAQPTIFRHFPTRDAIFRAALDSIGRKLLDVLTPILSGRGPADTRLRKLLTRQLRFISRRKGLPRLIFSERLHLEDPELKVVVRSIMDRYTSRLETLLQEGTGQGCFRQDLEAAETARLIVAMIQGLVMRWSLSDFEFPLDQQGEVLWRLLEPALLAQPTRSPSAPGPHQHSFG
ncbi:Transcriptional regulator, TetR family [Thioalkalivibrio nitratireducens DSM 14787]|uniref:Transcriptional regulator, TetR family n=1 Tax=Thioalkalivibrio nitratireducens (strain DSM 14787 / UNIQEM 213 / ALEN2) TaxID=1255043 RepID=L0DTZ4_THIND|nr:TetR family transcriptional regulator [Thioalkalivibrio nitratireducens]AGA32488.1 Transcriptional regulator, TetR family [Thioalkalivibrio nitratireducens DSM 14787]